MLPGLLPGHQQPKCGAESDRGLFAAETGLCFRTGAGKARAAVPFPHYRPAGEPVDGVYRLTKACRVHELSPFMRFGRSGLVAGGPTRVRGFSTPVASARAAIGATRSKLPPRGARVAARSVALGWNSATGGGDGGDSLA